MKFLVSIFAVFTAIVGISCHPRIVPKPTNGLRQELQEFFDLSFNSATGDLVRQYIETDEEFQSFVKYTSSEAFNQLLEDIRKIPEFQDLVNYIQDAGMMKVSARTFAGQQKNITGGMAGFYKDLVALMPIEKLRDLYFTKLETSEVFADFVHRLKSPSTQRMVDKIMEIKELQRLIRKGKQLGIDFEPFKKVVYELFGIKFPTISI